MGVIPIHTTTCFLDVVSGDLKKDYKVWDIPYLLLEDLFSPSIAFPKINLEVTRGVTSWNSVTISSSFTQWTAFRLLLVFIDCKKNCNETNKMPGTVMYRTLHDIFFISLNLIAKDETGRILGNLNMPLITFNQTSPKVTTILQTILWVSHLFSCLNSWYHQHLWNFSLSLVCKLHTGSSKF